MKLKKTFIYLSAIILLILINTVALKAQSPGTPCGDPDLDCPIDTPVILLATAVLFLTVKKILDAKNKLKNCR